MHKQHYDAIASQYAAHYGDAWSLAYRREFINGPMLGNIDLNGAMVVDAMCGSGETTGFLLEKARRLPVLYIEYGVGSFFGAFSQLRIAVCIHPVDRSGKQPV